MFKILGKEELELQQWSSDEMVINPCMNEGDEVVFVNGKGKHIVTQAYRMDGTVVADVPNDFLQQKGNILVYLEQGKNRHHECETVLSVLGCDKPNGYKCKKNEKVFPPNQANWNQNDPTKADYVKNRPFWTDDPVETVLIEETTNEWVLGGFGGAFGVAPIDIAEGDTYSVMFDGVKYECIAYIAEGPDAPSLGDGSIANAGNDGSNGEPFFITVAQGATVIIVREAGEHTVSVMSTQRKIHKIPEKYLPDGIGGGSGADLTLLFDYKPGRAGYDDFMSKESGRIISGSIEQVVDKFCVGLPVKIDMYGICKEDIEGGAVEYMSRYGIADDISIYVNSDRSFGSFRFNVRNFFDTSFNEYGSTVYLEADGTTHREWD